MKTASINTDCSFGKIKCDLPESVRPEPVEGHISSILVVRQAQGERPNEQSGINLLHDSIAALRLALKPFATVYRGFPIIVSAIALLTITAPSGAEELGRLFFTPEQRTQLERAKLERAKPEPAQQQNGDSPNNARVLTVNGIVQKHGGERTVWINGVPQLAGMSDELAPESLPVAVPGQSNPVKVKVGQKLILDQPAQQNLPASAPQEKQPADDD